MGQEHGIVQGELQAPRASGHFCHTWWSFLDKWGY